MKLSEFLKTIVPYGTIIIARKVDRKDANGRNFSTFAHAVTTDHDQAAAAVEQLSKNRNDIYYALASYKQGFHEKEVRGKTKKVVRVRENVRELKALWFDIDFKSGLTDPQAVVTALKEFSLASAMPPPSILVHSGNGMHAYWPFSYPIEYAKWQGLADALKAAAKAHGLAADLACTADACRVLRPPGTTNWKDPTNPKNVTLVYNSGKLHDPAQLEMVLGLGMPTVTLDAVPEHLKTLTSNYDELTGGVGSGGTPVESLFSEIVEKCAVSKHLLDTHGAHCSEPEWVASLQLLRHCTDGALFVHEVSNGHPGYTAAETEAKWEQRLDNTAGPTLCSTFEQYHPEKCAQCPFKGKIKTPLHLGIEQQVASPTGVMLTTWRPVPNGNGMERKMLNPETNQWEWVKVLKRTYGNVEASRSVVTRFYEIKFDASLQGSDPIEINLPSGHLGNHHKLKEAMASFGVPLLAPEVTPFTDFMATWLEKLQAARQVDDVTEQLGWIRSADDDDHKIIGFSAGTTSFYGDGSQRQGVRISKEFAAIGRMYEPKGQLAPWKLVASFLAQQNNPAFTAILASAFASPLLHFTGVQGGILSIVSSQSGVGKSSALKCAQAVWGSPTHGMNSVDDTRLSVARKLGFLNHLPAYWDELRGKKTMEDFMTLAFQVSQGKEKTRLDSTATMRDVHTWETMLIAASNESIFDAMGTYSAGSDAGVARTYEITVEPFDSPRSRAEIAMMFEGLHMNYGHAGLAYARYLAENHIPVRDRIEEVFVKMSQVGQMRAAERFWFAIMTSLVVGAEIAKKLGLVDIDIRTMTQYLMENLVKLRARSIDSMSSNEPQEILAAYIQQHQDRVLIVDKYPAPRANTVSYLPEVLASPKSDKLLVHASRDDGKVRVSRSDFVRWLASRDVNFTTVRESLMKVLSMREVKACLGLGTKYELPRQRCLEFVTKAAGTNVDDIIGDK